MAGRRIKETVQSVLNVEHVAVSGFSNEYSSYIATKEEYNVQEYEGASTLFGLNTLLGYQQEYKKLAQALETGDAVSIGANKDTPSVPTMHRITVRNNCFAT